MALAEQHHQIVHRSLYHRALYQTMVEAAVAVGAEVPWFHLFVDLENNDENDQFVRFILKIYRLLDWQSDYRQKRHKNCHHIRLESDSDNNRRLHKWLLSQRKRK